MIPLGSGYPEVLVEAASLQHNYTYFFREAAVRSFQFEQRDRAGGSSVESGTRMALPERGGKSESSVRGGSRACGSVSFKVLNRRRVANVDVFRRLGRRDREGERRKKEEMGDETASSKRAPLCVHKSHPVCVKRYGLGAHTHITHII